MFQNKNFQLKRMYSTSYDEKNKLWFGPDVPSLYNPKISAGQALLDKMRRHGSKIAQVNYL